MPSTKKQRIRDEDFTHFRMLVVEPTPIENYASKWASSPNFRGENNKCLKAPPSFHQPMAISYEHANP